MVTATWWDVVQHHNNDDNYAINSTTIKKSNLLKFESWVVITCTVLIKWHKHYKRETWLYSPKVFVDIPCFFSWNFYPHKLLLTSSVQVLDHYYNSVVLSVWMPYLVSVAMVTYHNARQVRLPEEEIIIREIYLFYFSCQGHHDFNFCCLQCSQKDLCEVILYSFVHRTFWSFCGIYIQLSLTVIMWWIWHMNMCEFHWSDMNMQERTIPCIIIIWSKVDKWGRQVR